MSDIAVSVEGVSKRYRIYHERNQSLKAAMMRGRRASYEEFWALKDVSLEIPEGSTFALVGDNGSGKSTLLKCMARILVPNEGRITSRGSLAALLELGSGFHPELSGRENVYLNGSILGMTKADIDRRFDEIVDFSGVEQFIDQPVKNYSSGMYVRLAFSVSINVDPEILLVDEVLAVGDAAFQEKCLRKFADYRDAGKTVVLVSHSLGTVRTMCDSAAWLRAGQVVEIGDAAKIVDEYGDSGHEAVVDDGGQVRHGTGEIRIERVELLQGGEQVSVVRSGDPVLVRMHYRSEDGIDRPNPALGMYGASGVHVWGTTMRESGRLPSRIVGEGVFEFEIPKLFVRPGRYTLNSAVTDEAIVDIYDHVRSIATFDVTHVPGSQANAGVVDLGGHWLEPRSVSGGPIS